MRLWLKRSRPSESLMGFWRDKKYIAKALTRVNQQNTKCGSLVFGWIGDSRHVKAKQVTLRFRLPLVSCFDDPAADGDVGDIVLKIIDERKFHVFTKQFISKRVWIHFRYDSFWSHHKSFHHTFFFHSNDKTPLVELHFLFANFHSYFQLFQWTIHFCCQSSTSLSLSTLTFTFQPKQMHICTELDASAAAGFLLGSDCVKVGDAVLNLRLKRVLKNLTTFKSVSKAKAINRDSFAKHFKSVAKFVTYFQKHLKAIIVLTHFISLPGLCQSLQYYAQPEIKGFGQLSKV